MVQTAMADRTRSSSVVRPDRVTQAEPVEWVELSTVSESDRSTASHARVAEIRREIAAGTYLTTDKIDAVVGKLLDVLHAPH